MKDVVKASIEKSKANKQNIIINEIAKKTALNILCEKNGKELPYDYSELYSEYEKAKNNIAEVADSLPDSVAFYARDIFPVLSGNGALITAGTRINWNGKLKRASVDLWDMAENNPDNNPSLWEDIEFKNGYRFIPETITAGTAFSLGELGWWKDVLYKSLIDANVWNPEQHQAGWEVVSDV